MSTNTVTLDSIREAAEKKYGSLEIDLGHMTVKLVNALRLPKERRAELTAVQDRLSEEGADQESLLADALRVVAETEEQANALLEQLGGDLSLLAEVFHRYAEGTQAGEA